MIAKNNELHRYKDLNFGFVIIAPECNFGNINCTVRSIKKNYPGVQCICVVSNNISSEGIKELNEICLTYKGKDTITSLINTGIKKGCKEWNLIVMEGVSVRPHLNKKYSLYIESDKDVLFPIVMEYNREGIPTRIRNSFEDATLNGTFIHQKMFKVSGDFADAPISYSKFMWAICAHDNGAKFKAILGAQLL